MCLLRYANGDEYKGHFKDGERFGHGVLKQGRHLSSSASIYVGEWLDDRRHGYGVQDDILKGVIFSCGQQQSLYELEICCSLI